MAKQFHSSSRATRIKKCVFFELGYEVYKFGLTSSIMLKVLYNFIILSVSLQRNTDSIEQSKVIC
jgi:hypothetical protein